MPRMGKTEEDWNGLKLRFLKTVQPNSFSKLVPAAGNFIHSDWGRVIRKIKQNELDCRDTAPLKQATKMCNLFYNIAAKRVEKRILRVLPLSFKLINNLICCLTGLNVGGKTRNIAFPLVLQQCYKTSCVVLLSVLPSLCCSVGKQITIYKKFTIFVVVNAL